MFNLLYLLPGNKLNEMFSKSMPTVPHYTSMFASLVSVRDGTVRKYFFGKARGCFFFLLTDESMFYYKSPSLWFI